MPDGSTWPDPESYKPGQLGELLRRALFGDVAGEAGPGIRINDVDFQSLAEDLDMPNEVDKVIDRFSELMTASCSRPRTSYPPFVLIGLRFERDVLPDFECPPLEETPGSASGEPG